MAEPAAGSQDPTGDLSGRIQLSGSDPVPEGELSTIGAPGSPADKLPPLPPNATVPGYELLEVLGRGGMGVVYKARQIRLDRLVALKMILAGDLAGPAERARFQVEAEAVARLQHPNIVQIHEVGTHQGQPYFSLEFVAGGNLAQRLGRSVRSAVPGLGVRRGRHSGPASRRGAAAGSYGRSIGAHVGTGHLRRPPTRNCASRPQAGQHLVE